MAVLLLSGSVCSAVVQRGVVRTVSRPQKSSQALSGAVVRVRGSHNAVQSQENGEFSIILADKKAGEAFCFSAVFLTGYELADKELIGRPIACSESVVTEILMVNQLELQREKDAIQQKARQNVELYYDGRLKELEQQLNAGKIAEQEYRRQIDDLESKYEQFEPLLELMADRYARADYSRLDALSVQINEAIEAGNLDEAERLIESKGSLEEREQTLRKQQQENDYRQQQLLEAQQRLSELQAQTDKQRTDLQNDYYNLYSIALSRFQNDSAAYWLCRRADIDTTNIANQIETARFLKNMLAQYERSVHYLERAKSEAEKIDNGINKSMSIITHELAHNYYKLSDYQKAAQLYNISLDICEQTSGKEHPDDRAETLSGLAQVYMAQEEYQKAKTYYDRSLKIKEQTYGTNSLDVATTLNNLGNLYLKQKNYKKAHQCFDQVTEIFSHITVSDKERASNYNNLGAIAFYEGDLEGALSYFTKAETLYLKVLGASHPLTKNTQTNIIFIKQQMQK